MYSVLKFAIKSNDELYPYCDAITKAANNLKNAALFRVRQVLTMVEKPFDQLTDNEREVYNEIAFNLSAMGSKYEMPHKGRTFLSYSFLNRLMQVSQNPDYLQENLPRHSAQHVLKEVHRDMKGFYAAVRQYKADPSAFTGRPKLPGYCKPGGNHSVMLSNQETVIYEDKNHSGWHYVKLPRTKIKYPIRDAAIKGRLMQAEIVPHHGVFLLILILDDGTQPKEQKQPSRICAIDMGVNNLAAITNNVGKPCLLFKGGVIKSINQWYNKKMAEIQSVQTTGTTKKFAMAPEAEKLCLHRNNAITDFTSKTAARIIQWCETNEIDTIVIGKNTFWKQEVGMGKVQNQSFVQIPFFKLVQQISYRAERLGIRVVEQEESYTSKASFLDRDTIPVYAKETEAPVFSGKRIHRGIYRSKDGTILNADLNGSANVLRKAYPNAFAAGTPKFDEVCIIVHPDMEFLTANRMKQMAQKCQAKQKCIAWQEKTSNPFGIELCE